MRTFFLTLTLVITALTLNARRITPDEAMSAASELLNSATPQLVTNDKGMVKAPAQGKDALESPYYIFNKGNNGGFVIISGDDRVQKVLGYSDKGNFDVTNMPPQLKDLMEQWATQISKLPETGQHSSWQQNQPSTRAQESVLLETANWGQGAPYNDLCPTVDGVKAPTGCVATAMAIAMKYHNWPDYTRGDLQTDYFYPELGFDFSNYTIDWDALGDKDNPKFAEEVAKLVFGAGVCNSMYYGAQESSAYVWPIGFKMIELYSYAKGCQFISREKYNDQEWDTLLKQQIEEVGPVIYAGDGAGSHCFIVDGYDSTGMYHINWGWDGELNGFYAIALSGEEGPYFPFSQTMLINLKPDKERKVYSKAFIPDVKEYQSQEWNFFDPDIRQGERNVVLIPTITENCFNGYYGLAVVDSEENIKEIFFCTYPQAGIRYACPYPGIYFGNTNQGENGILFPKLKEGERYQLVTMDATYVTHGEENPGFWTWIPDKPSYDPSDWKIVLGGEDYPSYFYASGNKSEVSEFTVHVDEKLPLFMECYKKYPSSEPLTIRQLRWEAVGENYHVPKKGVTMRVEGRDKEGNKEDILINSNDYDGTTNVISATITMNMDYFDVYFDYEPDPDTRKDSGINPEEVIEDNGIVYKIDGANAAIIGYDNIPENITIPEYISTTKGKKLKVSSVESDAFLHAPVKHLSFTNNSLFIDDISFSGMDKLESISIDNDAWNPNFKWGFPFIKSPYKSLYYSRCPHASEIENLLDMKCWIADWEIWNQLKPFDSAVTDHSDIDLFVSNPIEDPENDYVAFETLLDFLKNFKDVYHLDDVIQSVSIPGIGDTSAAWKQIQYYNVPVRQMWTYAIDRLMKCILIKPQSSNIKIESVIVDDNEVTPFNGNLYKVPSTKNMKVVVNYKLNDEKSMTTTYSARYNDALSSTDLSGVDEILGEADGKPIDVYNLQGVKVISNASHADIDLLPAGIYIIGGEKIRIK